jgi:hypothetical protein
VSAPQEISLADLIELQRVGCAHLGSLVYDEVLGGVAADVVAGGVCAAVLDPHADDPWSTALILRFLGAVHRLVLAGHAPALAAHYPSAGGTPGPGLVADFLATVAEHRAAVEEGLLATVQTNEVGRAAALVGGYAWVARRGGLPLRVLELGASAGLNLRFDRFWFDTGETTFGDPASGVRFAGCWRDAGDPPRGLPDLATGITVAERAGCDRNPLDPTSDGGRLTLRGFVWPDQVERLARLDAALAIATSLPAPVEAGDLGDWLAARLADRAEGVATVVVHSIVWQYVSPQSRQRMRGALRAYGEAATVTSPLAWLRLEPAGAVADIRVTWWPGGEEVVLGTAEYHGIPVYWGATAAPGSVEQVASEG